MFGSYLSQTDLYSVAPLPQTVVIDPRSFGVEPEVGSIVSGLDDSKILVALVK